ncbi:MAG: hypothetical protein GEU91_07930 [Rhizobiales bacterium]|nr:hypothetical protein [Hyphomicrobiales bacterium]
MSPFRQLAEQTVARDAGFVSFVGIILMIAFSFEPPAALKSGATVALFFSIGLVLRASRLTDDGVVRLEAWRGLHPTLRPIGDSGRRWARNNFEELLLRTAKTASVIAIGFYCAALVASVVALPEAYHIVGRH